MGLKPIRSVDGKGANRCKYVCGSSHRCKKVWGGGTWGHGGPNLSLAVN